MREPHGYFVVDAAWVTIGPPDGNKADDSRHLLAKIPGLARKSNNTCGEVTFLPHANPEEIKPALGQASNGCDCSGGKMFKLVSLLSAKEQRQEPSRDHRPALELIQGGPHPDTGEVSETTTSLLLIADVLAELGGFGDVRERLGSRPLTELAANDAPRRLHVS